MEYELEHVLDSAFSSFKLSLNTCIPVTIKAYDSSKLLADVQPDIDVSFTDGTQIEAPIIQGVPVIFPMSSENAIVFPLEPGDKGIIVVSQRGLDNWKSDGIRIPRDALTMALSDAILLPGVTHKSMTKLAGMAGKGMNIMGKKIFIGDPTAIPDPTTTITKRDLVQILEKLIETLIQATYPVVSLGSPTGPMNPPAALILTGLKNEAAALKM